MFSFCRTAVPSAVSCQLEPLRPEHEIGVDLGGEVLAGLRALAQALRVAQVELDGLRGVAWPSPSHSRRRLARIVSSAARLAGSSSSIGCGAPRSAALTNAGAADPGEQVVADVLAQEATSDSSSILLPTTATRTP